MKKILLTICLAISLSFSTQAQNSNQDLQVEMDNMMEQMQEMMKDMGVWINDAPIFGDTTIVREFHFPTEEFDQMYESFPMENLSELFKGMEGMMGEWADEDMEEWLEEMEKRMEENAPPKDKKTSKKKRKTTTL
ncbi:MAG: hypothetical protein AB8F74_11905 [Saprospiraceae bacterium]